MHVKTQNWQDSINESLDNLLWEYKNTGSDARKDNVIEKIESLLEERDGEWREKIETMKDDGHDFVEADARDICQVCGEWREEHYKQPGYNKALSNLLEEKK